MSSLAQRPSSLQVLAFANPAKRSTYTIDLACYDTCGTRSAFFPQTEAVSSIVCKAASRWMAKSKSSNADRGQMRVHQ